MKFNKILMTLLISIFVSTGVFASSQDIGVTIDGVELQMDVPPIAINNRTLVPMRAIFEAMGANITWDHKTNTATGTRGSDEIKLQLGNSKAIINGLEVILDVPAIAINERTLVPIRFVSESLGADVKWNHETRTVVINKIIKQADKSELVNTIRRAKKINTTEKTDKSIEILNNAIILAETINDKTDATQKQVDSIISKVNNAIINLEDITNASITVNFKDSNLERVVRNEINKQNGRILKSDVEKIISLNAREEGIRSIEGIENLRNLKTLFLSNNEITDISPLKNLTQLEQLNIKDNKIIDYKYLDTLIHTEILKDYDNSNIEIEVLELVNIERNNVGLPSLKMSHELSNVARIKSQDMADRNYFNHKSPTYGSPFDMMIRFGIPHRTAGENIARGHITAKEVMAGLMDSSGHKANILSPNFGVLGVGYAIENGVTYWTQMFTD